MGISKSKSNKSNRHDDEHDDQTRSDGNQRDRTLKSKLFSIPLKFLDRRIHKMFPMQSRRAYLTRLPGIWRERRQEVLSGSYCYHQFISDNLSPMHSAESLGIFPGYFLH